MAGRRGLCVVGLAKHFRADQHKARFGVMLENRRRQSAIRIFHVKFLDSLVDGHIIVKTVSYTAPLSSAALY